MSPRPFGYWEIELEGIPADQRYLYRLDGREARPDPASAFQPEGVHGPSQVVPHGLFRWEDTGWRGLPWEDLVFYELHVGTFTPTGTFTAVARRLDVLRDLGVTAVELMPVAQFPGRRNWGYDGVYPYAVQNSYGGPEGLKRLVSACHRRGMAVILDVVYNHLGPEGNYLTAFGPYFTETYRTPWGPAVNFDGPYSDGVRNYVVQNALYWLREYHVDGLRLDAVHGIFDVGGRHILEELAAAVAAFEESSGRRSHLIAECDRNDARLLRSPRRGGWGLDGQWNDDFHHSLHTLLTGERDGYYGDFGRPDQLAASCERGFVYTGQYSPFRRRRHGTSTRGLAPERFVHFTQNHDQVGNRPTGERLSVLTDFPALKFAAGVLCVSPGLPLIFMGEEYMETAPFLYFIDHGDPALVEAVRRGRIEEFRGFGWKGYSPDPQAEATFAASRLRWDRRLRGRHRILWEFYREGLRLRRRLPALKRAPVRRGGVRCRVREGVLILRRRFAGSRVLCLMNPSSEARGARTPAFQGLRCWDASDRRWLGPGSSAPREIRGGETWDLPPWGFVVYHGRGEEVS